MLFYFLIPFYYNPCFVLYNCKVHGEWGAWNHWQECSKTCGEGHQLRYRLCDNPKPDHDGNDCMGNNYESRLCTVSKCAG